MKRNISKLVLATVITSLNYGSNFVGSNFVWAEDMYSDDWKRGSINSYFRLNDVLNCYDLNAEVQGGVARIKGIVNNEVEKELAGEISMDVGGISSVDNMIVVDQDIYPAKCLDRKSASNMFYYDATTTAKVKSRLLWSSGVPGLNVGVTTKAGVTTLSGNVKLASEKALAQKLAENTHGVYKVDNQIVVTNDPHVKVGSVDITKVEKNAGQAIDGAGDTISDAWIHAKVSTSLNFTRSLNVDGLDVNCKNGVITLSGVAHSRSDKELAGEITKDIKGVKVVNNNIRVM